MLTAASANAAWDTGAGEATGNGEFILSAWDSVREVSYTQDLGIRFDQAGASNVIAVDATAFSVFGGDFNGVSWNVAAASNFHNGFMDFSNYGFMVSGSGASFPAPPILSEFSGAFPKFNQHAQTIGANVGSATDNDTYVATSISDSKWAGEPTWGDSFGQVLSNGTVGAAGDLLNLHWLTLDSSFNGVSSIAGNVQFDMAAGQVIFNGGTPNPIPVPAAAWLLVSGLAGLGAVARRRKS